MIKEIEALQEAIEQEKRIAKSNYELADSYHKYFSNTFMRYESNCRERAEHHEQIAKWLEALLDRRTVKLEDYHIERLEALTDTKIEDDSDLSYAIQVVIDESYFDEFPEEE